MRQFIWVKRQLIVNSLNWKGAFDWFNLYSLISLKGNEKFAKKKIKIPFISFYQPQKQLENKSSVYKKVFLFFWTHKYITTFVMLLTGKPLYFSLSQLFYTTERAWDATRLIGKTNVMS